MDLLKQDRDKTLLECAELALQGYFNAFDHLLSTELSTLNDDICIHCDHVELGEDFYSLSDEEQCLWLCFINAIKESS